MALDQVRLGTPPSGQDGDDPRTAFTRINNNAKLLDDSGITGPVVATREVASYNDATQPGGWIGTATATSRPPGFGRANFTVALGHDGSITQEAVDIATGQAATRSYDPSASSWVAWVPGGFSGALPVARGGTGGTTQASGRAGLGLKSAAVADIVGPVSWAGGVPTGAIIERVSNANGECIKFADGSIESRFKITSASIAPAALRGVTWTYPVPFVVAPDIQVTPVMNFSNFAGPVIAMVDESSEHNASYTRFILRNLDTVAITAGAYIVAKGRWAS